VKLILPYASLDGFLYQTKDTITILDKVFGVDVEIEAILNEITLNELKSTYHKIKMIDLGMVDVKVPKTD
jgi:hypothetical protein